MAIDLRETNRNVAKNDREFFTLCIRAGIECTKRQASKFRKQRGTVYHHFAREKKLGKEITVK